MALNTNCKTKFQHKNLFQAWTNLHVRNGSTYLPNLQFFFGWNRWGGSSWKPCNEAGETAQEPIEEGHGHLDPMVFTPGRCVTSDLSNPVCIHVCEFVSIPLYIDKNLRSLRVMGIVLDHMDRTIFNLSRSGNTPPRPKKRNREMKIGNFHEFSRIGSATKKPPRLARSPMNKNTCWDFSRLVKKV